MSENDKKDFEIDPDALDIEWLRQPRLALKWSDLYAHARTEVRNLKQESKFLFAKISKELREEAKNNKDIKITDSYLDMKIELDPRYIEVMQKLNKAMYEEDIISGRYEAIRNDKKLALGDLIKMWIGNYFAGPKVPRDIRKEFSKTEVNEEEVRDKLLGRKEKKDEKKI